MQRKRKWQQKVCIINIQFSANVSICCRIEHRTTLAPLPPTPPPLIIYLIYKMSRVYVGKSSRNMIFQFRFSFQTLSIKHSRATPQKWNTKNSIDCRCFACALSRSRSIEFNCTTMCAVCLLGTHRDACICSFLCLFYRLKPKCEF